MATMDKLMKAFESLKSFQQQQGPPTAEETAQKQKKELATTKKDRVAHCMTICENIIAQSLRTSPEFQKLLGIAMEMFLLCSDDRESDVRMVADECLNKIIKALMDSNLPRLQLELYKEIKKDFSTRDAQQQQKKPFPIHPITQSLLTTALASSLLVPPPNHDGPSLVLIGASTQSQLTTARAASLLVPPPNHN
uniref:huntingtin-like n=1 Tax=Oncorhynchus gorbuscha TaxID=8017 RepID=UPI001EAECEC6|nr:huntingtin-like [Oncorhynchus gorbuscha]